MGVGIANVMFLAYGIDYVDTIESKVGTWWSFWLIEFFSFYWVKLCISVEIIKAEAWWILKELEGASFIFLVVLGCWQASHLLMEFVQCRFLDLTLRDSGPTGLGWLSGIFIINKCPGDSFVDSSLSVIWEVLTHCSPFLFPLLPCANVLVLSRREGVSEGEDLI